MLRAADIAAIFSALPPQAQSLQVFIKTPTIAGILSLPVESVALSLQSIDIEGAPIVAVPMALDQLESIQADSDRDPECEEQADPGPPIKGVLTDSIQQAIGAVWGEEAEAPTTHKTDDQTTNPGDVGSPKLLTPDILEGKPAELPRVIEFGDVRDYGSYIDKNRPNAS